jgi:hypothetical protein
MKKHPGPLKRVKKSNKQVFLIFKTYWSSLNLNCQNTNSFKK